MCGIFGITGRSDRVPTLIEGLERLEYRGYDSCGIAVIGEGKELVARKGAGGVEVVCREERFRELSGMTCLGHTRWATHGRVSRINAHPHFDGTGTVAVVHNGILENHQELHQRLEKQGCRFLSETDTEVVAFLIEEKLTADTKVEDAIMAAIAELEGTFAIGVIISREPGKLWAVRRESPLILGLGKDFTCFASDPLAFSELTSKVVYLRDGELVVIDPDGCRIRNIENGKIVEREPETLELPRGRADRGDHPDFMSKEISENGVVTRTALSIPMPQIDSLVDTIRERDRTYLTGMGTAFYVALMGQYLLARWGGRFLPALSADEILYLVDFTERDHLLAISQSGETYDTLKALRAARSKQATTSAILNVPSSSMARETDRHVDQKAGPEICVLSTKSTVSQLAVLARVALRLGERDGTLPAEQVAQCREQLQLLPGILDKVLHKTHHRLRHLARRLSVIRNWFFIGRGIYYGLALEAALKFKEVTYSHAEGMPAGFLKHGTISLIDDAMHTAIFLPGKEDPELRTQTLGAAAEIKARSGFIVAFQPEGSDSPKGLFDEIVEYPQCGAIAHPFLGLMLAQLFAYYTARALGRNVDKPRALAKSVTVG